VYIDGLDATSVYDNLAAPHSGLRVDIRRIEKTAAAKRHADHRAGRSTDEISASSHFGLFRRRATDPRRTIKTALPHAGL
jgi:hypothetical protein